MGFERFSDKIIYDYSTKHGGVSTGVYATMNLSFSTGDELANIKENFRRWCTGQGVDPARTVMVGQTHTTNVIYVDESHCGEGLERDRIQDVDGMITDRKGIALITSHADCVPLYFYDPVHEAIGLAHAGWRGTVGGMAAVMLEKMGEAFGTDPADVYTRIGPCISQQCFECDRDVVDAVMQMPVWESDAAGLYAGDAKPVPGYAQCLPEEICTFDAEKQKYHVSLSRLDRLVMLSAGVPDDHIDMADTCTFAHDELYFSHRRQGMTRGGQAALLMMKE